MQISSSMMFYQNMLGITNATNSWLESGLQLNGKRVLKPSDDPLASSQAVQVSQVEALNQQYAASRSNARQNISTEENILNNVTGIVQQMQTLVVNAGNGTLSDDDRASLATELEGLRNQLLSQANSTDGQGNYIFGGYKNDKPPFEMDAAGNVTYVGGDTSITAKVDANSEMKLAHTGNNIFMALTANNKPEPANPDGTIPPSEANIFTSINSAINSLKTPLAGADDATKEAAQAQVDKANRGLSNSLNNVLSVRAELGTQLKELDRLDAVGKDRSLANAQRLSDLTDTDWYDAISNYVMKQASLQASYKVFQDMSGMSLFQIR